MSNQFKPGYWSELKRLAEAELPKCCGEMVPTGVEYGGQREMMCCEAWQQGEVTVAAFDLLQLIAENERLQGLACAVNSAMHEAGMPVGADPAELADMIHRLQVQVATLQSSPDSWQSGYDKGRLDGTKTRLSELEQERRINAELSAEVEALRKDAERYRWLRNPDQAVGNVMDKMGSSGVYEYRAGDELDAAIDSAMGKDNPA